MAWITPVNRRDHPCNKPYASGDEYGKLWRCEVCDDLFIVVYGYGGQYKFERVGWIRRWRYRGQGYSEG